MSGQRERMLRFVRRLGSAVASQALLSAAAFAIGLLLIRRASDAAYGAYVLAGSAILLVASLQNALVGPALAVRSAKLEPAPRAALVGGLYVTQRRLFLLAGALGAAAVAGLWALGHVPDASALLIGVTALALAAILHREYFRIVLFVQGRPQAVLRGDLLYAAIALAGVAAVAEGAAAAAPAVAALGVAAAASAWRLAAATRREQAWAARRVPGLLRDIAPLAAWSAAGAAIHWSFSQGYVVLVAATLDVSAVAMLAATRLLLMPVNLLSTGIGALMLPQAARWLARHGDALLWRRLVVLALASAALALAYCALLWWGRDWVFEELLRKRFAQRDTALALWSAIFVVMVLRDQLAFSLAAQGRFREMTLLTLGCALLSLAASYAAMRSFGVSGALAGMLAGETASLIGIVALTRRAGVPPLSATARV